jgi:hypothetical protein
MVSLDALEEFRIQTSSFAPEYGRTPGAQVSVLMKSGMRPPVSWKPTCLREQDPPSLDTLLGTPNNHPKKSAGEKPANLLN